MPFRRKSHVTVTPAMVEFVRVNSLSMLQSEIAMQIGSSVWTVHRIQKTHGFPHFTSQTGRLLRMEPRRESRTPTWVPPSLSEGYQKRVYTHGQTVAARWAREAKRQMGAG